MYFAEMSTDAQACRSLCRRDGRLLGSSARYRLRNEKTRNNQNEESGCRHGRSRVSLGREQEINAYQIVG